MKFDEKKMALLEAVLFTTSEPLSMERLMKRVRVNSKERMEQMLSALKEKYNQADSGITLSDLGGYRLIVKADFMENVADLTPHADLSRGLLRVLAIIAYHEPIKQSDIVKVIGNRTYEYVHDLAARGLIKIEKKSRTRILTTTPHFEEYFGTKKHLLKDEIEKRKDGEVSKEE
jgi:segregation and condensation protein B